MRFFYLTLLLNFLLIANLLAQRTMSYPFVVEGNVNVDTRTIKLSLVNDTSYYPKSARNFSAKIEHGKFSINGRIPYPQAYAIALQQFHISAPFLVGTGVQRVDINVDSIREVPKSDSHAMREYYEHYIPAFVKMRAESKAFSAKWNPLYAQYHYKFPDSLQSIFNQQRNAIDAKSDSVLLRYVTANPNSYWGLWTLVNLNNFGYHPWFDSIYAHFSDSLKHTLTGRTLLGKLMAEGKLNEGSQFPYISSVNKNYEKLNREQANIR